jgi:hypothetical protein
MEGKLNADFSRVRIHTGVKADLLNRSLSANAFTHGADIYFGQHAYNPSSRIGQGLLAHELTHVVQQGGAEQPPVQHDADGMWSTSWRGRHGGSVTPKIGERTHHVGAVQRFIKTKLPTRWYRRKGGSVSSQVNLAIDAYNANVKSGTTSSKQNEADLAAIAKMLDRVPPNKLGKVQRIKAEIEQERKKISAVRDVMALARKRARLQEDDPKKKIGADEDAEFMRNLEVLHATNPLTSIGGGRTVGDSLAASGEIQNIHQVGMSMIGGHKDSPKRQVAEIGLFYPQRYRRASFSRSAHQNESSTKGIRADMLPPASVLPKYAALNLAGSDFGALADTLDQETAPLHFALRPKVLKERTTVTSSDSLRQWSPSESDYRELYALGMVPESSKGKNALPEDDKAWNTGPIATYDSEHSNLGQVLDTGSGASYRKGKHDKNPQSYVEAQVHGELLIDRDIGYVRANFAKLFGNPRFASLYSSLKASKTPIKWYFRTEQTKEGNLVTQTWKRNQEKGFASAWKKAAKVWSENNKQLRKGLKKGGMLRSYESLVGTGALSKPRAAKLYQIWQELQ